MKIEYQRATMTAVALSAADIITCSGVTDVEETEPIVLPIHSFHSSSK